MKIFYLTLLLLHFCIEAPCLDKKYNEVTQVMAHNASSHAGKKLFGKIPNPVANQNRTISEQLSDGVRAFKLPIHRKDNGEIVVAHALTNEKFETYLDRLPLETLKEKIKEFVGDKLWRLDAANIPLQQLLEQMRDFLDENPREIITLLLNNFAPGDELAAPFEAADIVRYRHGQSTEEAWPTIEEMIGSNKRLVVFADTPTPDFLYTRDFFIENPYSYKAIRFFDAEFGKLLYTDAYERRNVEPKNTIFLFNHFVTPHITGSLPLARQANSFNCLYNHVAKTIDALGVVPTFIHLDFYSENKNEVDRVIYELNSRISW